MMLFLMILWYCMWHFITYLPSPYLCALCFVLSAIWTLSKVISLNSLAVDHLHVRCMCQMKCTPSTVLTLSKTEQTVWTHWIDKEILARDVLIQFLDLGLGSGSIQAYSDGSSAGYLILIQFHVLLTISLFKAWGTATGPKRQQPSTSSQKVNRRD